MHDPTRDFLNAGQQHHIRWHVFAKSEDEKVSDVTFGFLVIWI